MKISENTRYHFLQLLHTYFNSYLIIVLTSFFATALHKDLPFELHDVLRMHVLLILPGFYYFLRVRIRHFAPFFILHLAGFLCVFVYLPLKVYTGVGLVSVGVIGMIFYSCVMKFQKMPGDITLGMLLVSSLTMTALYFLSALESINIAPLVQPYLLGAVFVLILLYFMNLHMENVYTTLDNVEDMVTSPLQKIRQKNGRILLVFMGIMVLLIALALVLGADGVLAAIAAFFNRILRFIIRLFPKGGGEGENPIYDATGGGIEDIEGMPDIGDAEPSLILNILQYVLIIGTIAAIIVAVIYGLYRFYRWFYEHTGEKTQIDEYEESRVFIEDKVIEKKPAEPFWERFRMNNRKRVRAAYKKYLDKEMRFGKVVSSSDAPEEILRKLPSDQLARMTPVYEKARYSTQEITKEDVQSMEG